MSVQFSVQQRACLASLVDTFFPSLARAEDPTGFWARSGSDLGLPAAVEDHLRRALPAERATGIGALLDALDTAGLPALPVTEREAFLARLEAAAPAAGAGVQALRALTLLYAYALAKPGEPNPNWRQIGYPGPYMMPPSVAKPIRPFVPRADAPCTLDADVVIIGSGAGGSVAAYELARRGRRVVVLEAGGYYNEADFPQLEQWGYRHLFYQDGFATTVDGSVSMLAGATLGGGTTVNWMNCVPLPSAIRAEWAERHGLGDLADRGYDRHEQAVLVRLGATTACSDHNGPHRRLRAGAEALGYAWRTAQLNIDPARYQPERVGYAQFGDASGCRRGAVTSFLVDATHLGARILTHTRAHRIVTREGRAIGVEARYHDGEAQVPVRIQAPVVVVAAGGLQSPALLLRSGLGGPAVGRNLHIHPVILMFGVYEEDLQGWWGPPQAGLMEQFADLDHGFGYLVEGAHYLPGLFAAALAERPAADHKTLMARWHRVAPFMAVLRDRAGGKVTIDGQGEPEFHYALEDPGDRAIGAHALGVLAALHVAAGAHELTIAAPGGPVWRRGEDLDAFLAALRALPCGVRYSSAHQMSTCRLGTDPERSVANPRGELHDARGVWIADTSAFPSAVGVNPMVACMALARRTAEAIAEV
jgi:choline dehydrogenase-like flavoprotein